MKKASRGRKRLESATQSVLSMKQDKPNLVPALLGAYINGQKTVLVAGRNDFVWVRLRGTTSEVVQAFNDAVGLHWDLPILVYRDPNAPNIWKIYGRDIRAYADWGNVSYLPPHGDSHSFSGVEKSGVDPVWVQKRQYMPLLPRPVVSGTTSIYLEPDFYYFNGQYHYWPGSGTSSLIALGPTGSTTARFVTVFINAAGNPDYIQGPEYAMIPPPPDVGNYISLPTPDQGVPIAAVRLYTGTTSISWGDIYDLRSPQQPLAQTGSRITIFDESVYQGAVYGINFVGANVEAVVSGTFAHVFITGSSGGTPVPTTGSFTLYDESVLLGQATALNFVGSGVEAVMSGTVAHIMHTGSGGGGHSTGTMVIYDESSWLGVFEEMRFIGGGVEAYNSGSYVAVAISGGVTLPTTGSFTVFDESILLGQATALNFVGSGVEAVMSGTVAHIMHTGSGGGGHSTGTMVIYDENTFVGVFEEMRFIGAGVQAFNSGSYAAIAITGTAGGGSGVGVPGTRSTYLLVGEPVPLTTITGAYWKVPTDIYATGSLNLFIDGLSQLAGTAFTEQYPASGSFHWEFALPTGVQLEAKWGHPVDQVQSTGTITAFDESILLGQVFNLNFVGAGVQVVVSGTTAHIIIA